MARLSRLRQILLAVLLASAAGAAWAMPPLLAAVAVVGAEALLVGGLGTVVFAGITVGNLIFASSLIYGVVQQRRAARGARRRGRRRRAPTEICLGHGPSRCIAARSSDLCHQK